MVIPKTTSTPVVLVALLVAVAAGQRRAYAEPGSTNRRALEARRACAAGDVDQAIKLLGALAAEGDDNAIYNQGRCYQLNGLGPQAIAAFREYLKKARNVPPSDVKMVQGFIQELEKAPPPPRSAPPPAVMAPAPAAPPAPPPVVTATRRGDSDAGGALRTASYVVAGVGVAALAAGAYYSLRVRQLTEDLESATSIDGQTLRDKTDEGNRAATLQWVGYGVGAAALVGAAVMFVAGQGPAGPEPARVSFVPLLSPGGGGGLMHLRF